MRVRRSIMVVVITLISQFNIYAQGYIGIKSNILYGALCYAPNLGVEFSLDETKTIDISAGYNGWNRCGSDNDNRKLAHFIAEVELRRYLCKSFSGHFFGLHGIYSHYNISDYNLPWLFGSGSRDYRFEGYGVGGGLSYGYQLPLARRWNMEFELGVGYMRLSYDKYRSCKCSPDMGHQTRNYFGPTRAGVSIIYLL